MKQIIKLFHNKGRELLLVILSLFFSFAVYASDGEELTMSDFYIKVLSETNKTCEIVKFRSYEGAGYLVIPPTVTQGGKNPVYYKVIGISSRARITDIQYYWNGMGHIDMSGATNLEYIGDSVFYFPKEIKLESIDLSGLINLKKIGKDAFRCDERGSSGSLAPDLDFTKCVNLESIGERALYGQQSVTKLDFSNCSKLSSIGAKAFCGMGIESIVFHPSAPLKEIPDNLVYDVINSAKALTTVVLPVGQVERIGKQAFKYSHALESINPDGLTNVKVFGEECFRDCEKLSFELPVFRNLERIEDYAFYNCGIKGNLDLPSDSPLQYIGTYSLAYNSLTSVDLSNLTQLAKIGNYAFYGNSSLKNFSVKGCQSLTSIGNAILGVSKVGTYSLPAVLDLSDLSSLTSIGTVPFMRRNEIKTFDCSNCPELTSAGAITYAGGLKNLLMGGCPNLFIDGMKIKASEMPALEYADFSDARAKEIAANTFSGFQNLKTLKIGGCLELEAIGENAFSDNPLLEVENLNLSESRNLVTIGDRAFSNSPGIKQIDLSGCIMLKEIGEEAFLGCSGLEKVNLKDCRRLKKIGDRCFKGSGLTEILLPEAVTSVGVETFTECQNLKYIVSDALVPPVVAGSESIFSEPTKAEGILIVEESVMQTYSDTFPWSEIGIYPMGTVGNVKVIIDQEDCNNGDPVNLRLEWEPSCAPPPSTMFTNWYIDYDLSEYTQASANLDLPFDYDTDENPLYSLTRDRSGESAVFMGKWPGKFNINVSQNINSLQGNHNIRWFDNKNVSVNPVKPTSIRFEKDEYIFSVADEYADITLIPEPANASAERIFWPNGIPNFDADHLVKPFTLRFKIKGLVDSEDVNYAAWIVGDEEFQEKLCHTKIKVVNAQLDLLSLKSQKSEMDDGTEQLLSVSYEPEFAYVSGFNWEIINSPKDAPVAELIATDDKKTMKLKALRPGEVEIKVSPEGNSELSKTIKVIVKPVRLEAISVPVDIDNFKKSDGNIKLNLVTVPENATVYSAVWSVDDESLLEVVSSEGKGVELKPKSIGTTNLRVCVNGTSTKYAFRPVTVTTSHPVEAMDLSGENIVIDGKGEETLSIISLIPEEADLELISWETDKDGIIEIEKSEDLRSIKIRSLAAGDCVLTVSTDGGTGLIKEVPVKVTDVALESISLDRESLSLILHGDAEEVEATITPANALPAELIWETGNSGVFEVTTSASGKAYLTGINPGRAKLTVYDKNNPEIRDEMTVAVHSVVPFTKLSFDESLYSLTTGTETTLHPSYDPADADLGSLRWESNDPQIAAVDEAGNVRGLKVGKTVITAYTTDGSHLSAHCYVQVRPIEGVVPDHKISLSEEEVHIAPGERFSLTATLDPAEAEVEMEWSVEDTSIVKVLTDINSREAGFYALKEGSTFITATSKSDPGISASCEVIVGKIVLNSIKIERNYDEVDLTDGTHQVRAVLDPYYFSPKLQWTSSDESVATIKPKENGYADITPLRAGDTMIRVEHMDHPDINDYYLLSVNDIATEIKDISAEEKRVDVYTVTGFLLRENIKVSELENLEPGVYLIADKNGVRKTIIGNFK
ncbi:MAG: leucine-rich repeat protein [Muribaculaceae bacterium]|nr:leucine-rich repeat protein [Muribaculaceae bacterium]